MTPYNDLPVSSILGAALHPPLTYGFKKIYGALAGVAQWIECQLANQRVAGSIPSQGTCLGCGPGSQMGGVQEATTH